MKKPLFFLASGSVLGLFGLMLFLALSFLGITVGIILSVIAGFKLGIIISGTTILTGMVLAILFLETPPSIVFWLARRWGYQGVELLLTKRVIRKILQNPSHYTTLAERYGGLRVSYHQPWDIPDVFCRFTILLRVMPNLNSFQKELVSVLEVGISPVIIHSNRVSEIHQKNLAQCEIEVVDSSPLPPNSSLVLDTWYSLYSLLTKSGFKTESIVETWGVLKNSGRCNRLHLYNISLNGGLLWKNLYPNDGILPVSELFRHEWEVIVLELNPIQIALSFLSGSLPTIPRMFVFGG